MASAKIASYRHTCVIPYGDMEGSTFIKEVSEYDVEFGTECTFCGNELATVEQIVLHMYAELRDQEGLG